MTTGPRQRPGDGGEKGRGRGVRKMEETEIESLH